MENQTTQDQHGDGSQLSQPTGSALEAEQVEILKHANRAESRGQFVGESPEMDGLVAIGLMKDIGKPSWCPDTFYEITDAGRHYLQNSLVGRPIDVNALICRIELLSKLLATCRDSLKANDYGEDAPGMTAFDKDLVKEIDIVLADDEQGR